MFIGLSAALLLSVVSVFINRMALSYTGVEFFFLLTIFFYLKFRENENKKWSYSSGISAGLAFLSSYLGIVAFLFLMLQSLIDGKIKKNKSNILTFGILSLIYPIIGLVFGWHWFVYDTFFEASRPFYPENLLMVLLLGSPPYTDPLYIGRGWLSPPYIFTLLGFISCFYLAFTKRESNGFYLSAIICILFTFLIAGAVWWSYLTLIYPFYCLGIAIMLNKIFQKDDKPLLPALLFSLILIPNFINQIPSIFNYSKIIFMLVFSAGFIGIVYQRLGRIKNTFLIVFPRFLLFFLMVLMLIGASFLDINFLNTNPTFDQTNMVRYINSHVIKSDMVAINPAIIPLLECTGVDYAQVSFYIGKQPQFLYEDVETMLSRFKMDINLQNFKYIVLDSPLYALGGSDVQVMTSTITSQWLPVFSSGDYTVYLNPSHISSTEILWEKDVFASGGWSFAYSYGCMDPQVSVEANLTILSTIGYLQGYSFWKINVEGLNGTNVNNMIFRMRYKVSETNFRVVAKFLDQTGQEIQNCGWFTDGFPSTSFKYGIYGLTGNTALGSIIIGMDGFDDSNIESKLYITLMEVYKT
ncbi:MAG: hypothetical protein QG670_1921 [Thermoproteota archaeon]|nr:hypothetical protein [Thermoproteota archaeon]